MGLFIYIIIFIIGLLIGSFATLAIYRIPIGENITHKRSFCPNCNHKLGFLDLIPVFSYVFLKGKCRYCSKKIGKRYIFIEICSGIIFLSFALSLNIDFNAIEASKFIYLVFGFLYFIALLLIAGMDKEKRFISKKVILYGVIVNFAYILYLYIVGKSNMYRYAIYLFFMSFFLLMNTLLLQKKGRENYTIDILILCMLIITFSGTVAFELTVILTLFFILLRAIKYAIKKDKENGNILPIGYYLCISNIIILILQNFVILGGD